MSLSLENIKFGYTKDKIILNNISFVVPEGETVSIIGVSGSGKSTLLRIISNLIRQTSENHLSGSILFKNELIGRLIEVGELSFMFQEPSLFPNLSVKKNVELPLKIINKISKNKVNDILKLVGLYSNRLILPKHLSGGMKTRTALARSFITSPKLLLLDEPFSALDIGWRSKLYHELLMLQKANGTTIVLVTHDIDEAIALSRRILILGQSGEIIQELNNLNSKESVADMAKEIIIKDHQRET